MRFAEAVFVKPGMACQPKASTKSAAGDSEGGVPWIAVQATHGSEMRILPPVPAATKSTDFQGGWVADYGMSRIKFFGQEACMSTDPTSRNLAAVEQHFNAERAGDWERIKTMYTDDIRWERPLVGQVFEGKENVAAGYKKLFSALTNFDFVSRDRFATEHRVVDDSVFTFEVAKEGVMPLPVGTRASIRLVHIFEMRDGQVCREIVMETPPQKLY